MKTILITLYACFGLGTCALYALSEVLGYEPNTKQVQRIHPSVRTPPGGGSGSGGSFWHVGSSGGK